MTAEQEYIFLLENDADNAVLVNGARQKLRLLGLSESQLRALTRTRRPDYRVAVFSPYDGYVVENTLAAAAPAPPSPSGMAEASAPAGGMGGASAMNSGAQPAAETAPTAAPAPALTLQEGSYVSAGQTLFQVMNTAQVWGLFQPGPGDAAPASRSDAAGARGR
ncbi:efflux RND transporter periplasmic adaptor subunit [Hymenobacter humi]|uniref:Efflux RND transporter periplasmic adaptor subunit n=1 Tax=Hymenobacter humi TaxID=1411620 RepID=A0ABW2UCG7_9BACT